MYTTEAASAQSSVEMIRNISLELVVSVVRRAESPSRSRPGSPRCCCADSLVGDAVVVPLTEAGSQQLWLRAV